MNQLEKWRKENGYTLPKFAKKCGICRATLCRIEDGKSHLAKAGTIARIENVVGFSLGEMVREDMAG